ncbi:MAG: mechanosensitive ion channel family protein [Acidimicrobiia bacterium]
MYGISILAQAEGGLTDACGANPGFVCEWVFDLTDNSTFANFAEWVVAKPVKVILILFIAFVANRLVRRGIHRLTSRLVEDRESRVQERKRKEIEDGRFAAFKDRAREKAQFLASQSERSKQRAQSLGAVLRSIASLVIYTMAAIIALGEFGVSLGPLVAGAGIVGVAVGFGAQTLVKDFLSGIFMLIEDQYGVGDVIDVGDATGVVEEVNLRTTQIRDVDGTVWFIPNGEIRRIGNKSQQWARAVLDVEVAYDTDIDHASAVIKRVADSLWHEQLEKATVLEEPEIWGVQELGASAIAIRVALKTEPGEQFATGRQMRQRLKEAFDAEGIEIPFPQHTVWMHSLDDAADSD